MVYGLWFIVYGSWFMIYGLWFTVYGLGFMVYGPVPREKEPGARRGFRPYGLWFMVQRYVSARSVQV